MKAYVGSGMAALILTLGNKWGEWLGSRCGCFALDEDQLVIYLINGWVDPRTGLGVFGEQVTSCPSENRAAISQSSGT